jgi:hypothetical protein
MCKLNSNQVQIDGATIASALKSIAALEQASNPTVAANLITAANALVAATQNWQTGDTTVEIEAAVSSVQAVLAVIPQTAPYAPFVAIASDALVIILANIQTQDKQTGDQLKDALLVKAQIEAQPDNPWVGVYKIKRLPFESFRSALVGAWNKEADKHPELNVPKL